MLTQPKARGRPKLNLFKTLFSGKGRAPAGQADGDALTGGVEGARDSGRAQAMSSDEAASRYIRVTWHETWQRLVLLAGTAALAAAIMVLLTLSHLPIQTAARITIISLASCGGGVGVGVYTMILRRRQASGQDGRDNSSS